MGSFRFAKYDNTGVGIDDPNAQATFAKVGGSVPGDGFSAAGFAGRVASSQSGAGALKLIARIPLTALIGPGSCVRVAAWFSKAGTGGGWGYQFQLAKAGAASGIIIGQRYPTTTQLQSAVETVALVGALGNVASTSLNVPYQNVGATGQTFGDTTSAIYSTANADYASGADLLVFVLCNNSDVVTMEGCSVSVQHTGGATDVIAGYGDSLTAGAGATARNDYMTQVSRLLAGRAVQNMGVGGQTSAQVSARSVADTNTQAQPHIFQMGRNDVGVAADLATEVVRNVRAAVNALGHQNYLVGSVTPAQAETVGTSNRTAIIAANAALAAAFPGKYVDTLGGLLAAAAAAEIPAGWYADSTHFNDTGYAQLAAIYAAAVTAAGW